MTKPNILTWRGINLKKKIKKKIKRNYFSLSELRTTQLKIGEWSAAHFSHLRWVRTWLWDPSRFKAIRGWDHGRKGVERSHSQLGLCKKSAAAYHPKQQMIFGHQRVIILKASIYWIFNPTLSNSQMSTNLLLVNLRVVKSKVDQRQRNERFPPYRKEKKKKFENRI